LGSSLSLPNKSRFCKQSSNLAKEEANLDCDLLPLAISAFKKAKFMQDQFASTCEISFNSVTFVIVSAPPIKAITFVDGGIGWLLAASKELQQTPRGDGVYLNFLCCRGLKEVPVGPGIILRATDYRELVVFSLCVSLAIK
jgi:hypothetical protein